MLHSSLKFSNQYVVDPLFSGQLFLVFCGASAIASAFFAVRCGCPGSMKMVLVCFGRYCTHYLFWFTGLFLLLFIN